MDPHDLLSSLEDLPGLLQRTVDGLAEGDLRLRPATGGFAVVEQAWHLADLEAEGFGARIASLLREEDVELPDFDGAGVAKARRYQDLDAVDGLWRFQQARAANLATLRPLPPEAWGRSGRQAGVGPVTLADLPRMMLEHDRSHARELVNLLAEIAPGHPALPLLRAFAELAPPTSAQVA